MRPNIAALLLLAAVAALSSCGNEPPSHEVDSAVHIATAYVPPVVKTIAGKFEKVESHTGINWWGTMTRKGIHTQQEVETNYYLVFTDGTSSKVPMEQYALAAVGQQWTEK